MPEHAQLRQAIIDVATRADMPRGVMLAAFRDCGNQLENRTRAELCLAACGYRGSGFVCSEDLELYYDISQSGHAIGFISKGWDDPGFRLGEVISLDERAAESFAMREHNIQAYCQTNGVILTSSSTFPEDKATVTLEYLIYSSGFNPPTFRQAMHTLTQCVQKVDQRKLSDR